MNRKFTQISVFLLAMFVSVVGFGFTVTPAGTSPSTNTATDGSASAVVSGGVAPFSYLWSNGMTTQSISGLSTGQYAVTVTDDNNLTATGSVFISATDVMSLTMGSSYETCEISDDGTASVIASGGTPEYTVQWSDPAGSDSWVIFDLTAGDYSVTVTDVNGVSVVGYTTVELSPEGIWLTTKGYDVSCYGLCDGSTEVSPMTGATPYTYSWNDSGNQTTQTATNLCAGMYNVVVTDANGCTATMDAFVGTPSELVLTTSSTSTGCSGTNTGSASASATGGMPGYTYSWSNGMTGSTITGLNAGTYTVVVTDANGCTSQASVTVDQTGSSDLAYALNAYDASCYGTCDGSATINILSGTAPFSYEWSTTETTSSVSGLCAGNYSVTVTDADGCPVVQTFPINQPSEIVLQVSSSDATCGGSNGSVTVAASGGTPGYTYSWDGGHSSATVTGLPAGNYPVTVTDANGCTATAVATVNEVGSDIQATISSVDVSCFGDCSGSATVTVTNGTSPFSYAWSNGATGATATNLCAGSYSVIVTDASGCPLTLNVTVGSPSEIVINHTTTPATCGMSNGGASATVSGGTGSYTYLWSTGETTSSISGKPAGNYILTVADENLCLANVTVTIDQAGQDVVATASATDASCNGTCDGTASISVTTGNAPLTYAWSNGDNTADASGLCAGDYGWTVTDADGCMATGMVTVDEPTAISVSVTTTTANCGADTGTATATASGGTQPYTYKWNDAFGQTMQTAMMLPPGNYTVLVTDANGCTATADGVVESVPGFTCDAVVSSSYNGAHISSIGGADGSATVQMTGGNAGYFSFAWTTGETTQEINGLSAGTYTVVVKDDLTGCTCESSVTLEDPAKLGNLLWLDTDQDGLQDAGETGVEGVTVTLTGVSDYGMQLDLTTLTDATGMYMFTVPPGEYKVTFDLPDNHEFTGANVGSDEAIDSDADATTGMTDFVTVGPGEYYQDLDAGLIKNCVNVGDYVWYDENQDGLQQALENGVPNFPVALVQSGPDGVFGTGDDVTVQTTSTDANGNYLFECVEAGEYIIDFSAGLPADYEFTQINAGANDAEDSDAGNKSGVTNPFTVVVANGDDLTIDAGIHTDCENVTNAGVIGHNQSICTGHVPDQLVTLVEASGGVGDLEYIWMKKEGVYPWEMIPGSTNPDYQPPALFTTTKFIKCVRRAGCYYYLEPDPLTVTVKDTCGGNFVSVTGEFINEGVTLDWVTTPENGEFNYYVEHSINGVDFSPMEVVPGKGIDGFNNYSYRDEHPKNGTNFYQITMDGPNGYRMASNVVKVMAAMIPSQKVSVFPNPANEVVWVDIMKDMEAGGTLQLFDSKGQFVQSFDIEAGEAGPRMFLVPHLSSGLYFVKVTVDGLEETMKLRKE